VLSQNHRPPFFPQPQAWKTFLLVPKRGRTARAGLLGLGPGSLVHRFPFFSIRSRVWSFFEQSRRKTALFLSSSPLGIAGLYIRFLLFAGVDTDLFWDSFDFIRVDVRGFFSEGMNTASPMCGLLFPPPSGARFSCARRIRFLPPPPSGARRGTVPLFSHLASFVGVRRGRFLFFFRLASQERGQARPLSSCAHCRIIHPWDHQAAAIFFSSGFG